MIRQLQIANFRCLRSVTLNLEPLTVFVGANASGKSSVFAALQGQLSHENRWNRDATVVVDVITTSNPGATESLTLKTNGEVSRAGRFPECMVFQLDLSQLRRANQLLEMHHLAADGHGLANFFATLTRRAQDEVSQQYCKLVPMFADIAARPSGSGHHRIVFQDRWRSEIWYEPNQVSDGSILLLAFLLLPYQSPAPDIVAIEEPERGLHPYLMGQLIGALRKLANGELGPRPVQVLLATHSAELLEFVEPREVRFFHRSKGSGETVVEQAPVDDPSWLKSLREYDDSLGDLWLSGGLGGVPGR